MKISTIATVIAATLLTVGLVPTSSAQDNNGNARHGIEVITITAKRPAPTVATACVNAVKARTTAAGRSEQAAGNASEETPASRTAHVNSVRQAIRQCIEQAG